MPKFTLQVQYLLPQWADITIEAETLEEACRLATTDSDGKGNCLAIQFEPDYDTARSGCYITGALAGEHESVAGYPGNGVSDPEAELPIPEEFQAPEDRMAAVLADALDVIGNGAGLDCDELLEKGWLLLKDFGIQR